MTSSTDAKHEPMIGLALSGGGSRAMAFHLGCMRALHDRGVLQTVRVVSAVSGGAILAALYAYFDEPFEAFDRRASTLLRKGLVRDILLQCLSPRVLLGAPMTMLAAGTTALGADMLRLALSGAYGAVGRTAPRAVRAIQPPMRRWISRTSAFEAALSSLFGDRTMQSARRPQLDVVINACDLRSGAAFRFGSQESACWRYGTVVGAVPLSAAVAASAAYPILLPALDREFDFRTRRGDVVRQRVCLTDGGVYDNLGASCLEPGRSPDLSSNTFPCDYIICCDAGHGLFDAEPIPYWWGPRLSRSFQSVFRRAQNGTQKRLHELTEAGVLKGFVLSYLGQQDSQLPGAPADLVPREKVASYPTDFSPMRPSDLSRLTDRGEQLTRLLVARYCPEL